MRKIYLTIHAFQRIEERSGVENPYHRTCLAREAFEQGKRYTDVEDFKVTRFLCKKTQDDCVAVFFEDYCFIFDMKNYHCITVYRLSKKYIKSKSSKYPKHFLSEDRSKIDKIDRNNRKKYLRYQPSEELYAA